MEIIGIDIVFKRWNPTWERWEAADKADPSAELDKVFFNGLYGGTISIDADTLETLKYVLEELVEGQVIT